MFIEGAILGACRTLNSVDSASRCCLIYLEHSNQPRIQEKNHFGYQMKAEALAMIVSISILSFYVTQSVPPPYGGTFCLIIVGFVICIKLVEHFSDQIDVCTNGSKWSENVCRTVNFMLC